ncbi:MAG: hypothetical protein JNL77_00395 [Nitrosomonas sp.]|nr:hypothetical protein [Nitrosomonas sp.]
MNSGIVCVYAIDRLRPTTMQPTVIINQHRHTAIIAGASGKKLLVIKLGKGKLTVTTVSLQEINAQGYTVSDYSPALAAQSYLQHGAGVSEKARQLLEKIAAGEFSDQLMFTSH